MEKGFTVLTTAVCLAVLLFIVIGGPCHLQAQKEIIMTTEANNIQTQPTKAIETANQPKLLAEGRSSTPGIGSTHQGPFLSSCR